MRTLNPTPKQKGMMDVCLRSKDGEQQWWQLMSSKGTARLFIVGEEKAIWKHLMKNVGPPRNSQCSQRDFKVEPGTEAIKVGWRFS